MLNQTKNLPVKRYQGLYIAAGLYLLANLATRLILVVVYRNIINWDLSLIGAFFSGILFDICSASYLFIPYSLYLLFLPQKVFAQKWHRWAIYLFHFLLIYLFWFGLVSELVFWDEFGARFNFIAVDYLVYTTEVIRNIQESYQMLWIYTGVFIISIITFIALIKTNWLPRFLASDDRLNQRWKPIAILLTLPAIISLLIQESTLPEFKNNYNREIGKNGIYSLFAAFWYNQIDFDQYYPTEPDSQCFASTRKLVAEKSSTFLNENDTSRKINHSGEEKKWNIIQITIESLSGEYMKAWENDKELTPFLDKLTNEGLFFKHLYAAGTRTVRGMEALTLSVPPTPGRSIVKRDHNENLFTIGSVFNQKGYQTTFLYGGNGYFDNMNYFFSNNGFKIVDIDSVPKEKITFENAWGACDEDLFHWALDEADSCYHNNQPFYQFIMTTSNHRPYTYPSGKINIPSGSGRDGAVRYTDYAIEQLIKEASQREWFKNTVFVIVADHCAGSARKQELPIKKYEIPLLIYSPTLIPPKVVDTLCSQIDIAPTIFGLLNWSYETKFYGKDILSMMPSDERALFGNYQKVALLKNHTLSVIKPIREFANYHCNLSTGELTEINNDQANLTETLAYYQSAYRNFNSGNMRNFTQLKQSSK